MKKYNELTKRKARFTGVKRTPGKGDGNKCSTTLYVNLIKDMLMHGGIELHMDVEYDIEFLKYMKNTMGRNLLSSTRRSAERADGEFVGYNVTMSASYDDSTHGIVHVNNSGAQGRIKVKTYAVYKPTGEFVSLFGCTSGYDNIAQVPEGLAKARDYNMSKVCEGHLWYKIDSTVASLHFNMRLVALYWEQAATMCGLMHRASECYCSHVEKSCYDTGALYTGPLYRLDAGRRLKAPSN